MVSWFEKKSEVSTHSQTSSNINAMLITCTLLRQIFEPSTQRSAMERHGNYQLGEISGITILLSKDGFVVSTSNSIHQDEGS